MATLPLPRLFRRSSAFVRAARARGLPDRVARSLEEAAREVFPGRPEAVLESRGLFEKTAMRVVIGDVGNLEISFRVVDELAAAVETLKLARSSDVPDPFRRVWITSAADVRKRGVVLRTEDDEVAVFCPPGGDDLGVVAGDLVKLRYRGFTSPVEFTLMLDDAVRLPGGLALHLNRPEGAGAIGRMHQRFSVRVSGEVRDARPGAGRDATFEGCEILDVSAGGLLMVAETAFDAGVLLDVALHLPDDPEPFQARALVQWSRAGAGGRREHGLAFRELPDQARPRLERWLESLL